MAYNYDDQIPTWSNEGTEPASSVQTEGFKAGYKPPAAYFNWFWSHTMKWLKDLRTKLSSLHTQVGTLETKVSTLENKDYDVSADSVLTKLKSVDGAESGLDADLLDGKHASEFAGVNHTHTQYATASHTHANATETSNGFMSAEDKKKLNKFDPDNLTTYTHPATHPASMITGLAAVATSGNYADLINKPQISAVGLSGSYEDLTDTPTPYTHPATHPATMITETTNLKFMTADERIKLAGIAAQANKYVHPDSHPASMISGLADYMATLGYSKVATGSYIGDGAGGDAYSGLSKANPPTSRKLTFDQENATYTVDGSEIVMSWETNPKTISLPFEPMGLFLIPKASRSLSIYTQGTSLSALISYRGYYEQIRLSGSSLTIADVGNDSINKAGYTYYWLAF